MKSITSYSGKLADSLHRDFDFAGMEDSPSKRSIAMYITRYSRIKGPMALDRQAFSHLETTQHIIHA